MDVRRQGRNRRKFRRAAYASLSGIGLIALLAFAFHLARRPPAVDSDTIVPAEVTRGVFVHEITGSGKLVALDVRTVTNRSDGVVERVRVQAGHRVDPGTVLIELSSPTLKDELTQAIFSLESAEADELLRLARAEDEFFRLQIELARAEADYTLASLENDAQRMLMAEGAGSMLDSQSKRLRAEQSRRSLRAVEAQLERYPQTSQASDTSAEAKLEQQRHSVERLRERVDELDVTAGFSGVVQRIDIEEGQRLSAGSEVARIVDPSVLIARVRVSERDAALVVNGQTARLELGRERLSGTVTRVEPTVRDGAVTVDIALKEGGHANLRPDLTVTARVEIARIEDTLMIERPSLYRNQAQLSLFRLDASGRRAAQATAHFGAASTRHVEITGGLQEGDRVIISDMTDWTEEQEIRVR